MSEQNGRIRRNGIPRNSDSGKPGSEFQGGFFFRTAPPREAPSPDTCRAAAPRLLTARRFSCARTARPAVHVSNGGGIAQRAHLCAFALSVCAPRRSRGSSRRPRARVNRIRACSLLHASRQTLARQTQCRKALCRHARGAAPRAAGRCEGGSSARAGASESHSSAAHAAHDPHHHCARDVARSRCSRRQDCALVPVLRTGVQSRAKIGISAPCQGLQVEHRRQIRHA